MLKQYAFLFTSAILVGLTILFLLFLFDSSDKGLFYTNRNLYYISKTLYGFGVIFSVIFAYISYNVYRMYREENLNPIVKIVNEPICPFCGSSKVIVEKEKMYCLNCGRMVTYWGKNKCLEETK